MTQDTDRYCGCGCNQRVAGKTIFRQGHDARMISLTVVRTYTESDREANYLRIQRRFGRKLADKYSAAAYRKINRALPADDEIDDGVVAGRPVTAKVGRWTKEGHLTAEGDFVTTDAKGHEVIVAKGKYQVI